jgi:hypothetical protein
MIGCRVQGLGCKVWGARCGCKVRRNPAAHMLTCRRWLWQGVEESIDTMPSPVVHDQDECIAGEEEEDLWIVNTARAVASAASAWQQLSPSQRILQVCARASAEKALSKRFCIA